MSSPWPSFSNLIPTNIIIGRNNSEEDDSASIGNYYKNNTIISNLDKFHIGMISPLKIKYILWILLTDEIEDFYGDYITK